jgi:hypothetical protein
MIHARIADSNVCLMVSGSNIPRGAVAAWPQRAPAQTTPQAAAQNWPQRVARIIVPYAPGGGTDAIARILQAGLSKSAGYQIIIVYLSRVSQLSVPHLNYKSRDCLLAGVSDGR